MGIEALRGLRVGSEKWWRATHPGRTPRHHGLLWQELYRRLRPIAMREMEKFRDALEKAARSAAGSGHPRQTGHSRSVLERARPSRIAEEVRRAVERWIDDNRDDPEVLGIPRIDGNEPDRIHRALSKVREAQDRIDGYRRALRSLDDATLAVLHLVLPDDVDDGREHLGHLSVPLRTAFVRLGKIVGDEIRRRGIW